MNAWKPCTSALVLAALRPLSRQVAQVADRLHGHETGLEQAMLQQLSDPLTVLHVGLTSWHLLNVLRVNKDYVHVAFEEVEDWLPVDARRFHGHERDLIRSQPVEQLQQVRRGGAEGLDLTLRTLA